MSADSTTPLPANGSDAPGETVRSSCPVCEHGVVWEDPVKGELICDSCYVAFGAAHRSYATSAELRSPPSYDRREHDTYDNSERKRCYGGYEHAYLSQHTGPEYAIDAYGKHDSGLLAPHDRNWER